MEILSSIHPAPSPVYNARAALIDDMEKIRQNLASIKDPVFHNNYQKIFACAQDRRLSRNNTSHAFNVANQQPTDWNALVGVYSQDYPLLYGEIQKAINDLKKPPPAPKRKSHWLKHWIQ